MTGPTCGRDVSLDAVQQAGQAELKDLSRLLHGVGPAVGRADAGMARVAGADVATATHQVRCGIGLSGQEPPEDEMAQRMSQESYQADMRVSAETLNEAMTS